MPIIETMKCCWKDSPWRQSISTWILDIHDSWDYKMSPELSSRGVLSYLGSGAALSMIPKLFPETLPSFPDQYFLGWLQIKMVTIFEGSKLWPVQRATERHTMCK